MAKETPYIQHNITATRKAFGLDRVEERQLSGEIALNAKDIQENQRTIQNIRLWDQQPLLDTFGQIQEIRTYYEFDAVDNDRYRINGEIQQVMLSPRELLASSLPISELAQRAAYLYARFRPNGWPRCQSYHRRTTCLIRQRHSADYGGPPARAFFRSHILQ